VKGGVLRDPRLWIGLVLSSLFAYLALRGMDPKEVAAALGKADYRLLPPALLLTYVVLWVRARRWGVILKGIQRVETGLLFRVTLIGFLANYLLPARIGELVRAILLGSRKNMSISAALGSVVVERLLDLISILLIFSLVSLLEGIPAAGSELGEMLNRAALVFLFVAGVLVGLLWVVRKHTGKAIMLVEKTLGGIWPKGAHRLARATESFARGLVPARGPMDLLEIALWTACLWGLSAAIVIILTEAFGFDLPWGAAWFILVALGFGVSVPSAPGFVGTFHYAAMGALLLYGVDRSNALSFAIVLHATCLLPVFLLGIPVLWAEGMSLGRMARLPGDAPSVSGTNSQT